MPTEKIDGENRLCNQGVVSITGEMKFSKPTKTITERREISEEFHSIMASLRAFDQLCVKRSGKETCPMIKIRNGEVFCSGVIEMLAKPDLDLAKKTIERLRMILARFAKNNIDVLCNFTCFISQRQEQGKEQLKEIRAA